MSSKGRKNKEVAHEPQASVSLLFLPQKASRKTQSEKKERKL